MSHKVEMTYNVFVKDPEDNIHAGKINLSWEQARKEKERLKEEWSGFIKNFNWIVQIKGEAYMPM